MWKEWNKLLKDWVYWPVHQEVQKFLFPHFYLVNPKKYKRCSLISYQLLYIKNYRVQRRLQFNMLIITCLDIFLLVSFLWIIHSWELISLFSFTFGRQNVKEKLKEIILNPRVVWIITRLYLPRCLLDQGSPSHLVDLVDLLGLGDHSALILLVNPESHRGEERKKHKKTLEDHWD